MKQEYIVIFSLHGVARLPDDKNEADFFNLNKHSIQAKFVTDPEPYFFHIDRWNALASIALFEGLAPKEGQAPLEERLAAKIKMIRENRKKESIGHVFLVFEGRREIPHFDIHTKYEEKDFFVCTDVINLNETRKHFNPLLHAALILSTFDLYKSADLRFKKIGGTSYLIDQTTEKSIYSLSIELGSPRLFQAGYLSDKILSEGPDLIENMIEDPALGRIINLLFTSLDVATDDLHAYITSWTALEVFINATFKNAYDGRWYEILMLGTPEAAEPVLKRIRVISNERYRLLDKFTIISSILNPLSAGIDTNQFKNIKKIRDDFFHGTTPPPNPIETARIQRLLLKYLKLHVSENADDLKS